MNGMFSSQPLAQSSQRTSGLELAAGAGSFSFSWDRDELVKEEYGKQERCFPGLFCSFRK
jgi:hypothetical protein